MTTSVVILRSISKRRRLHLRGEKLTEKRARKLINKIKSLSRTNKPIGLWVDSRGGSTYWSLEIHKAIKNCRVPVYAYVTRAHSGALVIIQACTLRCGKTRSTYKAHLPRFDRFFAVWPFMDETAIELWLENARSILQLIAPTLGEEPAVKESLSILLQRAIFSGKTDEEFLTLLRENRELNPSEAMGWGFIDEVARI
jgi:ATP-dependent protease ClpP protease subunit